MTTASDADIVRLIFEGLDDLENHHGLKPLQIAEAKTFIEWCNELADNGLKVDGKPFRLDNRPALVPIYEAIPSTREEARGRILVIMKATQLGLTVWEVLASIYMLVKWGPVNIGMYLPDMQTAVKKSEHRFMRMVRSAPLLYKLFTAGKQKGKPKEGNVLTRTVAESILMFLWTSGKVTTESMPMDVVTLDEVQEMALDAIDKVMARMGDSDIAFALLLSTANMPNADIDWWYRHGTQEVWHTTCEVCGQYSDLSDPAGIFPDKSITYNTGQIKGAPPRNYAWTCPHCAAWIKDPQIGQYIVTRPDSGGEAETLYDEFGDEVEMEHTTDLSGKTIRSFLLPRTISPKITPRQIFEGFQRADTPARKKSFYNRTLARPYIDADQLPVTMAHCLAAAEDGMKLGLIWEPRGRDCFMGIDQMGGFNAVIIKKRLPDGRQAVVHVEAIFNDDPFARCDELIRLYGVAVCVVENLPNFNDARRFANRWPGRVFVVVAHGLTREMIEWGDAISRNDQKTAKEDSSRYSVSISQYQMMQTSLFRVRDKMCLFPDPAKLEQDVREKGQIKRIAILRDWVFVHFTKTALVVVEDEDERKPRAKVLKIGIDPHYSYANMLCDVAWARSYGTAMIMLPETPLMDVKPNNTLEAVSPQPLPKPIEMLPPGMICGRCTSFNADDGMCEARGLRVKAADAGCAIFTETDLPAE